jgi:hypothetical protein
MLTEMARYGTMCGFSFNRLAICVIKSTSSISEPNPCATWSDAIAIIVLHLDELNDRRQMQPCIDQAMFVYNASSLNVAIRLRTLLGTGPKAAVIIFQDGVLGRQIHWPFASDPIVQRSAGKIKINRRDCTSQAQRQVTIHFLIFIQTDAMCRGQAEMVARYWSQMHGADAIGVVRRNEAWFSMFRKQRRQDIADGAIMTSIF